MPTDILHTLRTRSHEHARARREVIALSNEALSKSKRAIFAYQREDAKAARTLLKEAAALFAKAEKGMGRDGSLRYEGAYRAALEEYAEALLFGQYLKNGKMGAIDARAMDPQVYLAGLCDATGEIVRHIVRQVTLGNTKPVRAARDTAEGVVEFMLELDATGNLRAKFDQAKGNLKRLEEILYDLSLR
ncbi:hypothetical protein FJZ23_02050 [Candidatus Parcubacteria bacterium]|nr:hypothetical protein [Candidatus Parcubacteria bacterium]